MNRRRFVHYAAPVAFLAAITVAALVVHAGLEHGSRPHTTQTARTTTVARTKTHGRRHERTAKAKKTYTVQSGDTLGAIARKTGTTVARLEQLNPGVDPTALHVGQKIRVQ